MGVVETERKRERDRKTLRVQSKRKKGGKSERERDRKGRESRLMEKRWKTMEATGLKGDWFRWQCNNINDVRKGGERGRE